MEKRLKIEYLGTAAAEGWPALFCDCPGCRRAAALGGKNHRLRSGALLNRELLVDMNSDLFTFRQKYAIDLTRLKLALLTHTHNDHFAPGIFGYNCLSYSTSPARLKIFCSPFAADKLRRTDFEKSGAAENLEILPLRPFEPTGAYGYTVTALPAAHNAPESYIYLVTYAGVNYLHGTDTGVLPEETFRYLSAVPLRLLTLDATMGQRPGKPGRHMNFEECAALVSALRTAGAVSAETTVVCSHFTHFIGLSHEEIEEMLRPHGMIPAYDGFTVEIG
jgi:phosphoribosyl 1,2-cyclic phosphate phosphodiesterase